MGSVSFFRLAKSVLIAFVIAILSLFLMAIVLYRADNPMSSLPTCVLAATLVGAWFSGFLGAKGQTVSPKLLALLGGICYFLLIFLGSFFFGGSQKTWSQILFTIGMGLVCVLFGAVVATRTNASPKRRMRRYHRRRTRAK